MAKQRSSKMMAKKRTAKTTSKKRTATMASRSSARQRNGAWSKALGDENLEFIAQHAASVAPTQLQAWAQIAFSDGRRRAFECLIEHAGHRLGPDWKSELLRRASSRGEFEDVRRLLDMGVADLDACSPLIAAAENDHLEIVSELLKAGANPNHGDPQFGNALDFVPDDSAIAKLLREHGGAPMLGPMEVTSPAPSMPVTRDEVLAAFEAAAPDAFIQLSKTEPLECFALCTDADLCTLYATGYSKSDRAHFKGDSAPYRPADWTRLEGGGELLERASARLGEWAKAQYAGEPEHVGPGDDHLRPWKRSMFESMVDVLASLRDAGRLASGVPILLVTHDGNDWWGERMHAAVDALNVDAFYRKWRKYR